MKSLFKSQVRFSRFDIWGKQPQIKRRVRIVLAVEYGIIACIWLFAWLVKFHHIFGLVWKS
jgi:hypothetical protein